MRGLWLFLVVLLAGLTTVHPAVAGPAAAEVTKNIPLPLAETERVLGRWLSDAGLTVAEDPLASGEMRITAHGAGVAWDIVLRADTPLATTARIRYSGDAADDSLAGLDRAVRDHLELSRATPAAEAGAFPLPVLERIEAIVCIHARSRGRFFQSSGFFVDPDGLILCTAHDLKEHEEVRVTTATGLRFRGDVLKADFARDLALIRINASVDRAVDVTGGRNLLGMGEQVFAIGCPVNLRGTVNTGTVNAPPRRAGDLPYWQVAMEVRPGSSGSAVFDSAGRLVGMVKGRYRGTDRIGFLIPLETIVGFLKEQL